MRGSTRGGWRRCSWSGSARTGPGHGSSWSSAGLLSFYITYVSYRNLKSQLPFVVGKNHKFDRELFIIDKALFLGHRPAIVLHHLLGTGISAEVLSTVYLWFLPLVPLALAALADLVAQPRLRLLVRGLPVHRLDPGHGLLLRAADARPGLEYPFALHHLHNTGASS